MNNTTTVDWFHRTEKRTIDRDAPADQVFNVSVPVGAALDEILALGYAAGLPKGSARAGVVEILIDEGDGGRFGSWTSPTRGRINPRTARWDSAQ